MVTVVFCLATTGATGCVAAGVGVAGVGVAGNTPNNALAKDVFQEALFIKSAGFNPLYGLAT